MSASGAGLPPLGGMAPLPLSAELYSVSLPCAMRGAHAALSPNLGAPATPAVWQAVQTLSKVALPASEPPAAPAPGAAATCATGVAGCAGGVGAGAFGSIAS